MAHTVRIRRHATKPEWVLAVVGHDWVTSSRKRLEFAAGVAAEFIAAEGGPSDDISLELVLSSNSTQIVESAIAASELAVKRQDEAAHLLRSAARHLTEVEGMGLRDAGTVLGLSGQRIQQLLARDEVTNVRTTRQGFPVVDETGRT